MSDEKDGTVIVLNMFRTTHDPSETWCKIEVLDNGEVSIWLHDGMEAPEQFNWLFAKLAQVGGALHREKMERTGME